MVSALGLSVPLRAILGVSTDNIIEASLSGGRHMEQIIAFYSVFVFKELLCAATSTGPLWSSVPWPYIVDQAEPRFAGLMWLVDVTRFVFCAVLFPWQSHMH